MRIKFFACSCRGDDEASASLDQFLNSHRIVSVEKNFVQEGHASFWAVCVTYVDQNATSRPPPTAKRGKVDYREMLHRPSSPYSPGCVIFVKSLPSARVFRSMPCSPMSNSPRW
jgi:hypothetical protein